MEGTVTRGRSNAFRQSQANGKSLINENTHPRVPMTCHKANDINANRPQCSFACMSIPMHVTLIPVFKMTTASGLYDTIWALPGPYVAFALPMSVFILTSFMKGIPVEIEQAAEIEGCGKYRNFFEIIVPLSKAGISTFCIYSGINFWNEFAFVKTLTQSAKSQTLPMAINSFKGEHSVNIPIILAVLALSALPMIIMFIILKDKLVKGMTAGAVK